MALFSGKNTFVNFLSNILRKKNTHTCRPFVNERTLDLKKKRCNIHAKGEKKPNPADVEN